MPLARAPHPTPAEQEPVERDALFNCQLDQEVSMRSGAVFVTVDILLEDAEFARELALRTSGSNFGKAQAGSWVTSE